MAVEQEVRAAAAAGEPPDAVAAMLVDRLIERVDPARVHGPGEEFSQRALLPGAARNPDRALQRGQHEIEVDGLVRLGDPCLLFGRERRRRAGGLGVSRHGRMTAKHLLELSTQLSM